MARPADEALYRKIKAEVNETYTKPSAYRSMAYTRFYIKAFKEKYGNTKKPYAGEKPGNLEKWRDEKWIDIKSFVEDPKNPTACGNEPYKKGEYPLCMPIKKAARYSKPELQLLLDRKAELKNRRLVKDAYLRDVLQPDETPPERIYKQKYIKDKKLKLPEPLPEKKAEKILDAPPIAKEAGIKLPKEKPTPAPKEQRVMGRPRKTEEEKQAARQTYEEARKAKRAEAALVRAEAKAEKPPKEPRIRALRERKIKPRGEAKTTAFINRVIPEGPITVSFD